ncbi:arginine methyl transferase [Hymenopellis radicata]|nr:arginine methyl transferase [Hymenopellis radicata]
MSDGIDDGAVHALTILGEHLVNTIIAGEPFATVKEILDNGAPVWYQNESEGLSPLHAAAYTQNAELVKYVIAEGAVWNALDNQKNSAGDIALSFNNQEIYHSIRDAGIRAEMLLALLSASSAPPSSSGVLHIQSTDSTAAGSTDVYLTSKLTFKTDEHGQEICVVNAGGEEEVGVMMGWERPIMEQTVKALVPETNVSGLRVLNVGFGLGIIDSLFQKLLTPPEHHVIIEAHPDVLQHMRALGWYEKPGVTILEGKWQDFVSSEQLFSLCGGFDVVYTDTFSEDYAALHQFFEHLPDLLDGPDARFSFFNGLGATNLLFYDVYTRISELHLAEVGADVDWFDVDVSDDAYDRWGKTREYFNLPIYRLPVGKMNVMG